MPNTKAVQEVFLQDVKFFYAPQLGFLSIHKEFEKFLLFLNDNGQDAFDQSWTKIFLQYSLLIQLIIKVPTSKNLSLP